VLKEVEVLMELLVEDTLKDVEVDWDVLDVDMDVDELVEDTLIDVDWLVELVDNEVL